MTAVRRATVAMILAVAVSCIDTPRTNPFDPQGQVELVLVGPDSATSIGDTVDFDVRSADGESVLSIVHWGLPPFLQSISRPGSFVVIAEPTVARTTGTLTAIVNANKVSKEFVFSQKAVSLSLRSCEGGNVLSFVALMPPGQPTFEPKGVCISLVDRRGNGVPTASLLSATMRDTLVARFVLPNLREVNAASVGSTYAVYTLGGITDSIAVNVRQDVAGFEVDPPECWSTIGVLLDPGQTFQVTPGSARDANGNTITDDAVVQLAIASLQWTHESFLDVDVSPTGVVTGRSRSSGAVTAELGAGETRRSVVYCHVSVN
jgi:hypothetical protein